MMFNRAALIAAAETEIERRNVAARAEVDQKNAELADAERAWVDQYGEAWLATLTRLRKKLRGGQPVYSTDLPSTDAWGNRTAVFGHAPKPYVHRQDRLSPDLANLVAVLNTMDGETVSASQLRTLLTSSALSVALRQLGRTNSEGN